MRMQSFGLMAIACLVWITSADAGEPSPADLIRLAPALQSTDPTIKSLEVVGSLKMKDAGLVRFRALYKAPHYYSILMTDAIDQTPLVYLADRQLLFYDPIRSAVTYLKDCSQRFSLESDGKSPRFVYGFGPEGNKVPNLDLLKLDVRSLLDLRNNVEARIIDEGEGRYRLFLLKKDRTIVCSFDTTAEQRFLGLKVFENTSNAPILTVDKLVVDGKLAREDFQFPDKVHLAKKIKIHELAGGFLEDGSQMVMISKAIQVRFEARHPGLRTTLNLPGYEHQTWKAIERHDQRYSAVLREMVPFDRRSVATKDPKKPADQPVTPVAGMGGSTTSR
jgi:hypothetical protein